MRGDLLSAVRHWLGEARSEGDSEIPPEKWPVLASDEQSGWFATADWTGHRPSGIAPDLYTKIVLKAGDPIKPRDLDHVPEQLRTRDQGEAERNRPPGETFSTPQYHGADPGPLPHLRVLRD